MGLDFNKDIEKELHFLRLYQRYKLLALNIFRWDNLPKNIESRHIEKALFEFGQAIFFEDKTHGLICLPCSSGGRVNLFNESKNVMANGMNYSNTIEVVNSLDVFNDKIMTNVNKGVRIINNDLMIPTEHYVRDYAEKMYNVENAININIDQQKFPYFVTTNKNTEFTFKEMIRKIRKGEFAIFANKNISLDDVNVFDLKVPYVADKLNQYKYELEREILTFFGLNNNFEKKERLLVDEINSNNDFIDRNVEIMYKSRVEACKVINEIYGLDIKVIKLNDEVQVQNEE